MVMMMMMIKHISDEEEGNKHQLICLIFEQLIGDRGAFEVLELRI